MVKRNLGLLACSALLVLSAVLMSAKSADSVISKENGMTIVNTTTLGKGVKGFKDATPVRIFIKNNKVVKVETLPNKETPKFFAKVRNGLLNVWDGMTVKKAEKANVDGITGATFSSKAVVKNVQLGLKYYRKNK